MPKSKSKSGDVIAAPALKNNEISSINIIPRLPPDGKRGEGEK
jgi:hypothetical protein